MIEKLDLKEGEKGFLKEVLVINKDLRPSVE